MRNPGQGSKSRAWAQRAKSRAQMDRIIAKASGEKVARKVYTVREISDLFDATRQAALMVGELHGEAMLPRDRSDVAACELIGIVEAGSPTSAMISVNDVFSVTRGDFATGEWHFVLANGPDLYRKAYR